MNQLKQTMAGLLISLPIIMAIHTAGANNSVERNVDAEFQRLMIEGCASVDVILGGEHKVTVVGDAEGVTNTVTEVAANTLRIGRKPVGFWQRLWGGYDNDCDSRVAVTMPQLTGFDVSGSADLMVSSNGQIIGAENDSFEGSIAGSGSVQLQQIKAAAVSLSVSGSGSFYMDSLVTPRLDATVRGSGDISAKQLIAQRTHFTVMGSGSLRANHLKTVDFTADIMGSGVIDVSGLAVNLAMNIMGSGDFRGSHFSVDQLGGQMAGSGTAVLRSAKKQQLQMLGVGRLSLLQPAEPASVSER